MGLAVPPPERLAFGPDHGRNGRGFVWQCDSESRAALLVALQTFGETSFELACLIRRLEVEPRRARVGGEEHATGRIEN
jgi:hypothetical protein